jgi:hypothetical protein
MCGLVFFEGGEGDGCVLFGWFYLYIHTYKKKEKRRKKKEPRRRKTMPIYAKVPRYIS